MHKDWVVVGVAGATCSGKSTLAGSLAATFPGSIHLLMDDFFLDISSERHILVPEVHHINFEILSSLDVETFLGRVRNILAESNLATRLLILDGFLLLNEPRLASLCDVRLYLGVDRETCWQRRSARIYGPPDPPGYFDICVWPSYVKHCAEVKANIENVRFLDGTLNSQVLLDIAKDIINERLLKFQ